MWQAQTVGLTKCPTQIGRRPCGTRLLDVIDRLGRVVRSCPTCDRWKRGLCRDCPRPIAGKAKRCAACAVVAKRACFARYLAENRDDVNRRKREGMAADADRRARKNAYRKAWRLAHPEHVKTYRRREGLKQDPKRLARARKVNRRRRVRKTAHQRAMYHAQTPAPAHCCRRCDRAIPWEGRGFGGNCGRPPVVCVFCKAKERPGDLRKEIDGWAARADREGKVRRTPIVLLAPRSCLTCPAIMTGRRKRCDACLTSDRDAARRLLAEPQRITVFSHGAPAPVLVLRSA